MTTTPEPPEQQAATAEDLVLAAAAEVVDEVAGAGSTQAGLSEQDVHAMDRLDSPRRLLLVHAHPDDESIGNGATMAHYAAAGVSVTLVTCTRGELGEVIPPDLAHLAADREDRLGDHRVQELAAAMEALGVSDHRFLGDGFVVYRDSGMVAGTDGRASAPPDLAPGSFARADLDEAASLLVAVLREVRPQVLVTYEPGGGYGHPDHVQAHRVAMRAVEMAADPAVAGGEPWTVAKVYWTVPESEATAVVEAYDALEAKRAALRAHASQVVVRGGEFLLSNGIAHPVEGREHYRLARGTAAPDASRADGRESDLFAGTS